MLPLKFAVLASELIFGRILDSNAGGSVQCADLLDHTHHNQTGAGQGAGQGAEMEAEVETPEVQHLLGLDRRGTYVVSESVEKVGSSTGQLEV